VSPPRELESETIPKQFETIRSNSKRTWFLVHMAFDTAPVLHMMAVRPSMKKMIPSMDFSICEQPRPPQANKSESSTHGE
jgi:hypothetical protein